MGERERGKRWKLMCMGERESVRINVEEDKDALILITENTDNHK